MTNELTSGLCNIPTYIVVLSLPIFCFSIYILLGMSLTHRLHTYRCIKAIDSVKVLTSFKSYIDGDVQQYSMIMKTENKFNIISILTFFVLCFFLDSIRIST